MLPVAAPFHQLAATIAGLPPSISARDAIQAVSAAGYQAISLDAAHPELRPRHLDRSARRDLAGLLRRLELKLETIDLWINPDDFNNPARSDRALAAAIDAIAFAAELTPLVDPSTPVLAMTLPNTDARAELLAAAAAVGVFIADFAPRSPETIADMPDSSPHMLGIDPAAHFLRGGTMSSLESLIFSAKDRIANARLTDAANAARVLPSNGSLDPLRYAIALHTSAHVGRLTVDTRGLPDPIAALSTIATNLQDNHAPSTIHP